MTVSRHRPDRSDQLAASRAEVRRLAGQRLSEVTPSRRDFAQYVSTQKNGVAVIARFSKPGTISTLGERARVWDDAEAAALAVATAPGESSMSDLQVISDVAAAPILRDDLTLDPSQLYYARLHGADAVVVPAADLGRDQLEELVTVASSLHMACVIEVASVTDIGRAIQLPRVILGIGCRSASGSLNVASAQGLARRIPRERTVICLPVVESGDDALPLMGACDAVTLDALSLAVEEIPLLVARLANP